jgi:hypothetical protein
MRRIAFINIYLIISAALGPGVYSASNRNEYWKQKKTRFWGVKPCLAGEAEIYRHL